MSSCLAICGYISSNVGVVTSQTSSATSINYCVTPLYFLSTSSLESKISTGSCYVALGPNVTFDLLFKMFLRKCSNIGCIDSWMSFTHQIATPIPISNLLSSSHLDDKGDSKGEIATDNAMLYIGFSAYFPIPFTLFRYLSKTFSAYFFLSNLYTFFRSIIFCVFFPHYFLQSLKHTLLIHVATYIVNTKHECVVKKPRMLSNSTTIPSYFFF